MPHVEAAQFLDAGGPFDCIMGACHIEGGGHQLSHWSCSVTARIVCSNGSALYMFTLSAVLSFAVRHNLSIACAMLGLQHTTL